MSNRVDALVRFSSLLLAAPAVTVLGAGAAQAQAGPKLVVAEPLKDMGVQPKGAKIEWSFAVRNGGDADLVIASAEPNCGCTVAAFDKVIGPGKTGKVTLRLDTSAFAGPISKYVTLRTNDPSAPAARVTVSAIVKPYVDAYPAGFVRFNTLQRDTDKQAVTLYSEDAEPFEILSVTSPVPWIRVEKRKLAAGEAVAGVGRAGQAQYRIEVTVGGPGAKVGPIAEKIRIATNSKHQPEYLLSVSGVIRPDFRVEPTAINFGEVAASDTAATRTILLRSNDLAKPDGFAVTKAVSDIAGVTAMVKPTDKSGEYQVTLQVGRTAAPGAFSGSVKVHTNDPLTPVVTVPVKGTAKGS
jgi:hypothetical protein